MKARIALIGSDSFLARSLISELEPCSRITGYSRTNQSKLPDHCVFHFPAEELTLPSLLSFDHIIYCAGQGIQSGASERSLYDLNVFLPIRIAQFLEEHRFTGKLVTFGSYAEIGNNSEEKSFTEEGLVASILPVANEYGASKRLLSRFLSSTRSQLNFFHLILPTIYGFGENTQRLIPYLVTSLQRQQVPVLTSGDQTRQYLHVSDAARLVCRVLWDNNLARGVYNIPACETWKIKAVIAEIYRWLNIEPVPETTTFQRFDQTMKYLALDATKFTTHFPDWKPEITIKTSLTDYMS